MTKKHFRVYWNCEYLRSGERIPTEEISIVHSANFAGAERIIKQRSGFTKIFKITLIE